MKAFLTFVLFMVLPLLGGQISAVIAGDIGGAYAGLKLPPDSPVPEVFPVVWTILYLLMGLSSWMIYQRALRRGKDPAYYLFPYGIQLALNFCWSPVFFGLRAYWVGACLSAALSLAVIWMTIRFFRISRSAAWLQLPYILWSLFAVYLSFEVALLNP